MGGCTQPYTRTHTHTHTHLNTQHYAHLPIWIISQGNAWLCLVSFHLVSIGTHIGSFWVTCFHKEGDLELSIRLGCVVE